MAAVVIQGTEGRTTPGSFHARLHEGKLLLPRSLADLLSRQGVRTAEDLIAYLQSFPSGAAHLLHWSSRDVAHALGELKLQVGGHLPAAVLVPPRYREPPLGALDPDDLP